MVARSVARFTVAFSTPGTFANARSTRPTHAAQVMPCTERFVTRALIETRSSFSYTFLFGVVSAREPSVGRVASLLRRRREVLELPGRIASGRAHSRRVRPAHQAARGSARRSALRPHDPQRSPLHRRPRALAGRPARA